MTPLLPADRDAELVEALVADRYLEALLAAAERRAVDVPADATLDPAVRATVGALRRALVRVHPSFRFEERLAERLAELAAATARPVAAGAEDALVPFASTPAGILRLDPALGEIAAGRLDPADPALARAGAPLATVSRPVLVGGVASAAISLVGVALVAWRASRPASGPMTRAARAAHGRRRTTDALIGTGRLA